MDKKEIDYKKLYESLVNTSEFCSLQNSCYSECPLFDKVFDRCVLKYYDPSDWIEALENISHRKQIQCY